MQSASEKLFSRAAFIASAGAPSEFPADGVPEVAFLGRSNVGKSSAINALAGRRRLAFASKTPGRTQTINFYDLGDTARLVDLPGYGYARVAKSVRGAWDRLIGEYFVARRPLIGAVVLMDARHPLTAGDQRLIDWLQPFEFGKIALLTKSDKLSRAEAVAMRKLALEKLKGVCKEVMLFSSTSGAGIEQARELLWEWVTAAGAAAAGNKRPPV
jgi:GTP-binding protein